MPDWFYHTITRPILFHLPAHRARDFALRLMGGLVRFPFGGAIIDFLGHMRAEEPLQKSILGLRFPSSVGLGPWLDVHAVALPAFARFGFGFLEVGPVILDELAPQHPDIFRKDDIQAFWYPKSPSITLENAITAVKEVKASGLPIIVLLGNHHDRSDNSTEQYQKIITQLAPFADIFALGSLDQAIHDQLQRSYWIKQVQDVLQIIATEKRTKPLLIDVEADHDFSAIESLLDNALVAGASGILINGSVKGEPSGHLIGLPSREKALSLVRTCRERWGQSPLIIGAGGIHEPQDVLNMLTAGAQLVQVDSGLVFTGPGLPKRINDAVLQTLNPDVPIKQSSPTTLTWFWTTLMGTGMLFGSILALIIAATNVILPYDEAFLGMSKEQLKTINPLLPAFMRHDRVTLAGTMIAIGVLYLGLSIHGIKNGLHWAQKVVFVSAFAGFASFFLFLGFGYLDPFHAFVTTALFQFLLMGVHSRLEGNVPGKRINLSSDRVWRLSLWGQLLMVVHGFALLIAGAAISIIGVTQVFVPEDLEFMHSTADSLRSISSRLVPLIAHDRATFGGMLLSSGLAFLLISLWGYRRGSQWLWWMLLLAGLPAYLAAIGVHFAVEYLSLKHLLPAFGGFAIFLIGMILSFPFLCEDYKKT